MKILYFPYLLFLNVLINFVSYGQIQEKPKEFTKIYFVYETKSTYRFDRNGIFGDTIQLKTDLPNNKFKKIQSITDSTKTIGFIPYKNLSDNEIKHLRTILFHTNIRTEIVYNLKKNKAYSKAYFCSDKQTKEIFTNFLGNNCDEIESSINIFVFKDQKYKVISDNGIFNYKENLVKWIDGMDNIGTYEVKTKNEIYTNAIIIDPNLDRHISPIQPFSNCDYGIKKVISIGHTIDLISVTYE